MGQTLTNGIYLPDEGEVRCYDGLAANWTTLDSVVGGYRAHIANENIHITSAERNKWDNGVTQAYVLRYANTSLTALGTVAFSALDNTDNIKIGDKVLDSEGKLFALTAVDTANSTATLSALLIDLSKDSDLSNYYTKPETDTLLSNKATDSDVVHKSGNETISGDKVFNNRLIKNIDVLLGTAPSTGKYSRIEIADNNKNTLLQILSGVYDTGNSYARFLVQNKTADDGTGLSPTGTLRTCGFIINLPASSTSDGQGSITPRGNQTTDFGLSSYQWRNLWCKQLYLNGTQLDPSAFVTTDTNQTISGNKTFSSINGVEPSSLSLPSGKVSDVIDISSYLTYLDGTNNTYIAPANGWITINMNNCSGIHAIITGFWSDSRVRASAGAIKFLMPVLKNQTVTLTIHGGTINNARFIPCQGNI